VDLEAVLPNEEYMDVDVDGKRALRRWRTALKWSAYG
jgi:hypothetical protein